MFAKLSFFLHAPDDRARRNAFDERQTHNAPARGFNFFATVNFVQSIIAALHQDVGQQFSNQ